MDEKQQSTESTDKIPPNIASPFRHETDDISHEEKHTSAVPDLDDDAPIHITSFMRNIDVRHRIDVPLKPRRVCKQWCLSLCDSARACCAKCGVRRSAAEDADPEPPPNRYIYWGPFSDINVQDVNDGERTTKAPHLAHTGVDDDSYLTGSPFVSNYISTTKYTVLTFLPLNLLEQFQKKANLYFLVMACLALFPFSPKSPIFSWLPLLFVLAVSACKEAVEDYRRYCMDKEINHNIVDVYRPDADGRHWRFRSVAWQDLQVGDMVRVHNHGALPADILLLQSSTNQGLCNIETANLDGETNLKMKQALGCTYSLPTDEHGDDYLLNDALQFILECEAPHADIHKFEANFYFHRHDGKEKESDAIGIHQLLLRGCTLKNTDWVIGCVVGTGVETKIALNNAKTKFKRSNVDRTVDLGLYCIFGLQQVLCIFAAVYHSVWMRTTADDEWYQYVDSDGQNETNITQQSVLNYFTFLILLDILVPISLYVSMELVKFTQAYLISMDDAMVASVENGDDDDDNNDDNTAGDDDGKDNTHIRAQARTSNLNEELGQISFIFSDKTGTLTENKMSFLRCHVDGTRYGPGEMRKQNELCERVPTPTAMPAYNARQCQFDDARLAHRRHRACVNEFLTLLSVCHTVIAQHGEHGEHGPVTYNASSPDEKALVVFAKNMHYYFYAAHVSILQVTEQHTIDGHMFYVNIFGEQVKFEVLHLLEFTSSRKRMSVVVRDPRDGKLKLYCKGADNVIYQRLCADYKQPTGGGGERMHDWQCCLDSLHSFAVAGLRTLVCAYKEIELPHYVAWLKRLNTAKSAMQNRDTQVAQCYDDMEQDLTLLGATAIEDKLQRGVAETVANLSVAGIAVWVLTGDKVETAINIGRSCRLLTPAMNRVDGSLFMLDPDEKLDDAECDAQVQKGLNEACAFLEDREDNASTQGFVVSGKALSVIFPHRKHDSKGRPLLPSPQQEAREAEKQQRLLKCLIKCRAVLCCRVSPIQKAQMVGLIKQNIAKVITLAIGDGANDVPMIRAAHVGVGIAGQEGLQAVMASDYAIAQFRFLQDLLLIHGAFDYRRISVLILYSFYKNVMLSMTQIYFGFYSGFSGTLFYDQLAGSTYNLVYTAFPVMFAAVFDRFYSKTVAKLCPELYTNGPRDKSFNLWLFIGWCALGAVHGFVIFLCSIYFIDSSSIGESGRTLGFWSTNTTMFTCVVTVATLKMMLETRTWTGWSVLFFVLSYAVWYLYIGVWSSIPVTVGWANQDIYGVAHQMYATSQVWFVVLLTAVLCIYPDILCKFVRKMWRPQPSDVVYELEFMGRDFDFVDRCCVDVRQQREREIAVMQKYRSMQSGAAATTTTTEISSLVQKTAGGTRTAAETMMPTTQEPPRRHSLSQGSHLGFAEFQADIDEHNAVPQWQYMQSALSVRRFSLRVDPDEHSVDAYEDSVDGAPLSPKGYGRITQTDEENE
mmetsp:Transcript_28287/g.46498  ORF Transcript_28287/g.46498 Transcript_28287/m.46498 type:complete len:1452 (+) Transcript_28287:29-4384(+)